MSGGESFSESRYSHRALLKTLPAAHDRYFFMSSVLDKYKNKIAIETGRDKDIDSRLPAACQEKSFSFNAKRRGNQRSLDAKRCSLDLTMPRASQSTRFTPDPLIFPLL